MVLCYPVYIQKREITPQRDDFPARAGARGACIGGRYRQKRVPFSRFNPVETMAFPHGTASRAAEPAIDPQGVRTRRCSAVGTVRTAHIMIPQTDQKNHMKGWGNMNKTRMGKRVASLLLSLVMMLSLLPTAAYAAMGDADETQGASVSENGTRVSDDSNSGGDTGDLQVGDSEDGGTADDTTGAEGGADTTGAEGGADPTDSVNATTTYVAYIGEVGYETLDAAITAAGDGETVVVSEGEYTLNGSLTYTDKAITVKAADGAKVTFDMSKAVALHGAKITFENVTFNYTNADYTGLQHTDTVVYNNCTINGKMFLYANSETFNDCLFVQKSEDYNVWTYGAKKVAFNNCTFDCVGKAVNVYIEKGNASDDAKTIEVNGCTVNSDKAGKAFLNIKNSTQAYDVTLSGTNTVTGLANDGTTGSALYQVETTKVTETTGNPVTVKQENTAGELETVYEVKQPSTSELTDYVTVRGIKGFEDTKFATFADASVQKKFFRDFVQMVMK